jgi:NADH:ubiquinone oxidoreductase subunit 6 (subunit J)
MQTQRDGNMPLAIGLLVLAAVFAVAAIFYLSTKTSFLASSEARHYKHAVLALILCVLCLIGANFARRPQG